MSGSKPTIESTMMATGGGARDPRDGVDRARVLILEDEYFIADDLAKAVRTFGAEVVGPFASCDDALDAATTEPLSLAIVDIDLNGDLAYPVVDVLKERGIPTVFATGLTRKMIHDRYRDIPLWTKPYLPSMLLASLRNGALRSPS